MLDAAQVEFLRQYAKDEAALQSICAFIADLHPLPLRAQAFSSARLGLDQLRLIFDYAPQGIVLADLEGHLNFYNPAFQAMLGYSADELLSLTYEDFTHPDDLAVERVMVEQVLAVRRLSYRLEKRYQHRDGHYFWVDFTSAVVLNAQGNPHYALGIAEDITERKRHQQVLEDANREFEAFTYSVSHDLRAPLRSVTGFTRILLDEHSASFSADALRLLRLVDQNAERMSQLIDALLAFSRVSRQPLQLQKVDIGALVLQVFVELPHNTRTVEFTVGNLPPVMADLSLLRVVLTNLLGNALKFTSRRPRPVIEVDAEEGDDGQVIYSVRDNGVGFNMLYAHKLFGVFQRLHRVDEYEGHGIGLATVQRIIHRHGGRIWAHGEQDKGATFYFTFK
ncbi:MAG: PAS domain S-box protein [Chloroflexi bacterium]|nr:PAS domain S-box protein [Chloroflexota bacterium]